MSDRYWPKVDRRGDDECWPWLAGTKKGHGRFRLSDGSETTAHRYVYELLVGPIPDEMQIDHLCRNRACQNVRHMEVVTPQENSLRGAKGFALTGRCRSGRHDMTVPENVYQNPAGFRQCRVCVREAHQAKYAPSHPRAEATDA